MLFPRLMAVLGRGCLQAAVSNHVLDALFRAITETLFAESAVCCVFSLLQSDCAKLA
jgi:hypothetical protein